MRKIDLRRAWRVVALVIFTTCAISVLKANSDAEMVLRFSFVCAKQNLPQKIQTVVSPLITEYRDRGVANYGDRGVIVGQPPTELYLVPLSCGATGNCYWGVVAAAPPRSLGVISGAVIDLSMKSKNIEAFTRSGAGEGDLETLVLRSGGYRRTSVAKLKPEAANRYSACIDDEGCCPEASNLTAP